MNEYVLTGGTVYAENGVFSPGFIQVTGGKITAVGPASEKPADRNLPLIDTGSDSLLLPGSVDIHIHGANGADVMDADPSALLKMASFLPSEGTTAFLATTMTQDAAAIERALACVSDFQQHDGTAELAGIHLEGPFISGKHPGAQPASAILPPDANLFARWLTVSGHRIKLVTLAPEEQNGLALSSFLTENGITVSAGHTDATFAQMEQAVQAGVRHVTHLYNGMRGMHHREPGTAGAALLLDSLYTEMIVDGIHIDPQMVRLAFQQKTAGKTVLITDSMRAKGLPDGEYELGGQPVRVTGGKAVLEDGTLAGSTLTMQKALQNMTAFTGCTIEELIQMCAENPAKQAGLFNRKGSIAPGKDADIAVYDRLLHVQKTICRGILAFEKEETK